MLAYNVREHQGDQVVWVRRTKKLATYSDQYRTLASVKQLAEEILSPLNTGQARPESSDTVQHFIEHVYLPNCKANLRPSTYFGYTHVFKTLSPFLAGARMRDFGPMEADRLLVNFAGAKPRANSVLKNTKTFLSGAFRYAVRTGVVRFNPMRETVVPRNGIAQQETQAYSLKEVFAMLKVLPEPSRTVVLVCALTGLRHSEVRGLKWEDFTGDQLHVRRAVWGSHVSETKTPSSSGSVPVLSTLRKALEAHHKTATSEFIFAGDTGRPLVLANVVKRDMLPELLKAGITWHGWHGFRRGLATNLYALGVTDKTIQTILRHANVSTTMRHYVKVVPGDTKAAMRKLERAVTKQATKKVTKPA